MRLLVVFALVLLFGGAAAAQTPPANPVIQHYRAYQAALARNDIPGAVVEAEWALTSSQQRDGDGGRTAVLALNLASVRLLNNDAAGAVEPAQQALRLAQGGASGVDARLAGLVLGRAEMATAGQPGADRLNTLLAGAVDGLAPAEIYAAASALGAWAMSTQNFDLARAAWRHAGDHADGAPAGHDFGLAVARTGEGAAIVMSETGSGSRSMRRDRAVEAAALFHEAIRILFPLFEESRIQDQPSLAVRAYAEAVAWRKLIDVKLTSDGQAALPADAPDQREVTLPPESVQCDVRTAGRTLEYPDTAADRSHIGVVVLWLRFDETGQVLHHAIVAELGDDAFAHEIDQDSTHWHVVRSPNATAGCRMHGATLVTINFGMGNN